MKDMQGFVATINSTEETFNIMQLDDPREMKFFVSFIQKFSYMRWSSFFRIV